MKADTFCNKIYSIKPGTPTTQTCSNCGCVKEDLNKLTLADRVYICKECGFEMDRDRNSAKFIYEKGLNYSILESNKEE